jgi:hypothetical protein
MDLQLVGDLAVDGIGLDRLGWRAVDRRLVDHRSLRRVAEARRRRAEISQQAGANAASSSKPSARLIASSVTTKPDLGEQRAGRLPNLLTTRARITGKPSQSSGRASSRRN